MGCNFSSQSSSVCEKIASVVQLNGNVEEFNYPVSVSEVTAKLSKHFVCTHSQLLSTCPKPLMPDTYLEPGKTYFLLPYSVFQSNVSPVDLASLARKLTNVAKTYRSRSTSARGNSTSGLNCASPVWRSTASSGNQFSERIETGNCDAVFDTLRSSKTRWKPILDTIRERSFNRRSESNVQENS